MTRALRDIRLAFLGPLDQSASWRRGAIALLALATTAATLSLIIVLLGANPFIAGKAIVSGSLGNRFNFGQTAMIASLFALTGLAAAVPFTAHQWNVGGEGQLYFGAFAAAGVALTLPPSLSHWFFAPVVVAAAAAGGALWGGVPGVLKAAVGANEVIVSLMMTYAAILLAAYAISTLWPEGAVAQTRYVPHNSTLPNIWQGTLVTAGAPLALGAVLLGWLIMSRTALGFEIRAVGLNPRTAHLNGMRVGRVTILVFLIGGAFAGLAGGIAVLGMNDSLVTGFSANFGFMGIAVALVARLSPIWIVPSAFLFAILRVGSNGLQVDTGLSNSVAEILVAVFVLLLLGFRVIRIRYAEASL